MQRKKAALVRARRAHTRSARSQSGTAPSVSGENLFGRNFWRLRRAPETREGGGSNAGRGDTETRGGVSSPPQNIGRGGGV